MSSQYIPLKFNRWQLLAWFNFSTRNRYVCGRGTGKTTFLAKIMKSVVESMPRSANALVCRTHVQALTRTLPAIVAGLETLGYYEGIHFVIGKRPPDHWPRPYFPPMSYEHFISFYTGAGYHIVSQDRKGSSRGFNIDSWIGDEGLNLNKEMIDNEISVANRANVGRFSGNPFHLSEVIASSQPILPESKWILDSADYYRRDGNSYEDYRHALSEIELKIIDSESEAEMQEYWQEAYTLKTNFRFYKDKQIIPITGDVISTYFCDADIFDNIENLGWRYIKQQRATMDDLMFKVEILNGLFTISEKCFYPDLCERHLYDIQDYSSFDNLEYNFETAKSAGSTYDDSIDKRLPIHISCDYGGSFNCMVATQEYEDEERVLNNFFAYHPLKIDNVVQQFVKFFSNHPTKDVHYWYDQTAVGTSGLIEYNYADEVKRLLKAAGWNVIVHYEGAAPDHQIKYLFLGKIFSERHPDELPKVRMHRENCRELYQSMRLAPIKQTSKGFEKDKSSERNKKVDQAKAPHLSDALDVLLFHKHAPKQDKTTGAFSKAYW